MCPSAAPKGSDDHFLPEDRGSPSPLIDIIDAVLHEDWAWGTVRDRSIADRYSNDGGYRRPRNAHPLSLLCRKRSLRSPGNLEAANYNVKWRDPLSSCAGSSDARYIASAVQRLCNIEAFSAPSTSTPSLLAGLLLVTTSQQSGTLSYETRGGHATPDLPLSRFQIMEQLA